MKFRELFSDGPVNTERQIELDFGKALPVLCLPFVHCFIECTPSEGLDHGIPFLFDYIIGSPISAPMFVFCMGVGMADACFATKIQADMLPNVFPAFPDRCDFDIYASMTPAKEVGGDFYDFFLVDDDHLALVMADVSGKGVPAALFMMMAMIMIRNQALTGKSPEDVLMSVNDQICRNNREQLFVTVWLGILELSTGKLIASNAGHEKPIIKHADGDYELIMDKHGLVVGAMGGIKYRNYELRLYPGSKLFVYTDGLMEASDEKEEIFGSERALEALNRAKDASPEELLEYVKSEVKRFEGGAPRFDDLTLLCLEYNGQTKREVDPENDRK